MIRITPYNNNSQNIQFGSASSFARTVNKTEIKELVDMFYKNSYPAPNPKANPIKRFIDNIHFKLSKKIRLSAAQSQEFVAGISKSPKQEIIGGYSMYLDSDRATGCVDFITLSPKIKGTKDKIRILLDMGQNICKEAKKRNLVELAWMDNDACKTLQKLIKDTIQVFSESKVFSPDESSIYVHKLSDSLNKIAEKYRIKQ